MKARQNLQKRIAQEADPDKRAALEARRASMGASAPMLKIERLVSRRVRQLRAGATPTPEEREMLKKGGAQ